jgi:hypothetical protein
VSLPKVLGVIGGTRILMRYLFWGTAPKYECENEAPNVFYDSVQIVAVNENMKWREVIILKPEQIEEHSSSNAVGHTVEVSSQKGYEKTRVRFVLVVNHHRPVLQSPTAEKVDIDVGPEIGELLEVIRKSGSFLQTIDIHVDTTFDFGTSISSIEVNINYKLAPKQQYQGGGEMGRAVTVFNPYNTHMPWERGKWQRMSTRSPTPKAKSHCRHVDCTSVCLVISSRRNDMIRLLFFHIEGSDNILGTLINVPCVEAYPHIMALYDNAHPRTEPTTGRYDYVFLCADLSIYVGVKVTRQHSSHEESTRCHGRSEACAWKHSTGRHLLR